MAKVTFEDVLKIYDDNSGGTLAVKDLNLDVKDGEFLVVVGPSGSGKSTTLRMLAGLESITDGEIRIGEEVVNESPPRKRDIALVFQSNALYPHKTVRGNMGYGLRLRTSLSDEEINERVEEAAEMMGIEELLDKKPASLSGGQQQRVALGRSLVREPEVILFDEPLSSLDQRLRLRMRTELRRIQQETGTTFIHVTHSQEDAMTVADSILLIEDGVVEQFDRPLELYHEPANEFVADFIGSPSMNLYDATFGTAGGAHFEVEGGPRLDVPERWADRFRERVPEGPVRLGVRPEAAAFDGDPALPTIDGTVTVVETFGDFTWYYLDAGLGDDLVVQSSDEAVMNSVGVGDSVTVSVSPDAIHTFDATTGDSLGTAQVTANRPARNATR